MVGPGGRKSATVILLKSKKMTIIILMMDFDTVVFFGLVESVDFHYTNCSLVSGSYCNS